ncbi:MAG: SpoIIE family protein phosphatase, partial [Maioricimonas sp. JB049]
ANRQWEILFGIDRQTMAGQTDSELFPEPMAGAFRANDELVARSGKVHEFEETVPHADGPHTYLSLKFPLRRSNGEIYGVAGISTDISERIEAERENEWLKHRLELILNSIGDGLYGVDCSGRITFANFAAARMLGWDADELCGQDHHAAAHHVLDGRPTDRASCRVCEVSRAGVETDVEEDQFRHRDGSLFPVEYTSTPVFDEGSIVGSVVTFRDISERIRREQAEEELRTAQAVQQLLYPRTSPTLEGVDIAGATHPAAMACGDYFDFIRTGSDEMVLALGDVSGHGLGPALQMVEARAYLRATINAESDECQVLTQLNRLLVEDTPVESFLTLVLARIDARSRSFRYAGAGHNAYLMRSNGQIETLPSTGIVLGLVADFEVTVSRPYHVAAGDLLLLLSDGLQETMSPRFELFGMDRALAIIREHRDLPSVEIIERLYHSSRAFACEDAPRDDITVVIARFL